MLGQLVGEYVIYRAALGILEIASRKAHAAAGKGERNGNGRPGRQRATRCLYAAFVISLRILRTGHDQIDRHRLLVQLLEVRVLRVFLRIPAQRFAGKIAGDGDRLTVVLAGDEQVLMGYHIGVARAEQAPDLQVIPVIQLVGNDSVVLQFLVIIDPCQFAVVIQIALLEGVQIGGDVVLIGVSVADAVPVSGLDLCHQRDFRVDLGLRQRLYGHLDLLGRKHAHGGKIVSRLRAVRTVEDLHRQRDGLCRLAGQRTVDPNTRTVRRGRRFDHAGIAAGDDDRGVLAVDLQIARGRELNVVAGGVNTVFLCQLFAGDEILQSDAGKGVVQLGLIIHTGTGAAGHGAVKCAGDGNAVYTVAFYRCGQNDGGILCRVQRDRIGRVIRIVRRAADRKDPRITARPCNIRPCFLVCDLRQLHIRCRRFRNGQCICDRIQRLAHLGLVPVNAGIPFLLHACAILGENERRIEIAAVFGHARIEIVMDRAILINAGIIAAVRHSFLDGNRNALTARVQQLLFHCGDGVGIRAVNRFEVTGQLAYGIVQLCFRCRHVGRVQRQDIFLGVGFARFSIGDRCRDGDLCRAACGQYNHAAIAQQFGVAAGIGNGVALAGGRQAKIARYTDNVVRRKFALDSCHCLAEHILRPDSIQIIFFSIFTIPVIPLTVNNVSILILDCGTIGTDCPTGKVVALTGKSTFIQLHVLTKRRGLVSHRACNGRFIIIHYIILDNVLIIAPLGNQRDLIQTAKIGILVHGFAERTITVFDIPAIQRLVCGIRITGQIRQLAEHLVRFYRFVRNGALIAVAVKMYCDALCPMGIQGNTLFGVFRREFILVGDLIAALGRIKPAVK